MAIQRKATVRILAHPLASLGLMLLTARVSTSCETAQPTFSCVKAMTHCGGSSMEECLAIAGCNFDGGCVESGCEIYVTTSTCGAHKTCVWMAEACRPTAVGACGDNLDEDSCSIVDGCTWAPGCGGKMEDCGVHGDKNSCNAASQCVWMSNGTMKQRWNEYTRAKSGK